MKQRLLLITLMFVVVCGILYCDEVFIDNSLDAIKENPKLIDPTIYKFHFGHGSPTISHKVIKDQEYYDLYYKSAAANYLTQLKTDPGNKNTLYNLSCCYGMLNQPHQASRYLSLAFQNGVTKLKHVMKSRKFRNVIDDPIFKATVDSLQLVKADLNRK